MRSDKVRQAKRDVVENIAHQAAASGGYTKQMVHGDGVHPWADDLIRQFTEAWPTVRTCPHLQAERSQASFWTPMAPDLLACQRPGCGQTLVATVEERLGHSLKDEPGRCSACGKVAAVRGVSLGVGTTMIRALICGDCEADDDAQG